LVWSGTAGRGSCLWRFVMPAGGAARHSPSSQPAAVKPGQPLPRGPAPTKRRRQEPLPAYIGISMLKILVQILNCSDINALLEPRGMWELLLRRLLR